MSNGIPGYNPNRVDLYGQVSQQYEVQKREAAGREASAPADNAVRQAADASRGEELSAAEAGMIDQYFPSSPQMTLRLYGPGRQNQSLNPTAVGSRLDLRG